MKPINIPFNIKILDPKDERMKALRPVTALDIFDNSGINFHPDGLHSTLIFGKVGDEMRKRKFSFINIKATVFHPTIFAALIGNRRMYLDIVSGKGYALWDDKEKDFVPSDPLNGKTGFNFFLEHWKDIVFHPSASPERTEEIKLIHNYKHVAMTDRVMVIPASMRELEIGEDGRSEEDEINKIYRKLLAVSNTIPGGKINDRDVSDAARYKLQMTFIEIYESLKNLISGKRKLILAKWAGRNVVNGTRNVLSPLDEGMTMLGDPGNIGPNNTVYGLYQALRTCLPVAIFEFKNNFLNSLHGGPNSPVKLVNSKTLKSEMVTMKSDEWDKWFSDEGVDKLYTLFKDDSLRHEPVVVGKHYLSLIYKGKDKTVKLLGDIDDLPEGFDRTLVTPVTYCELIYLSVERRLNTLPIYITRYPVASIGSIYPSIGYIKTTTNGDRRWILNSNWEKEEDVFVNSFPILGEAFLNTLCPNMIHLGLLNADFDGDVGSSNGVYTDESVKEVNDLFKKKKAYVDPKGGLMASAMIDTANLVCFNLTR